MPRARKLSRAGIAVGALALTVSTSIPPAYGHGYTNAPISRAKHCANGTVQNCGQIQWEPQSTEGPKGFPGSGPADGTLCSIRDCVAIRLGAIAKPARNRKAPISHMESSSARGAIPQVSANVPTRSR